MKRVCLALITFCLLQACQSIANEENITHEPPGTIVMSPNPIEADTAYLHYLDSLYTNKLRVEVELDSENIDLSYHFVPQKFDFTGDGTMDYLTLSSFDHRFVMGYIIDGTTGKKLNEWDHHYGVLDMDSTIPLALNFNRPDHDRIETRVVDVNCKDNQKELLVICDNGFAQMGGPVSYCDMFRYDQETQSVKSIFKHTIEYHGLGSDPISSAKENVVNYLDLLYEDKPCIDSIRIWKAQVLKGSALSEGGLDYKLIRRGHGESKLFQFNEQENVFEEVDLNISGPHN